MPKRVIAAMLAGLCLPVGVASAGERFPDEAAPDLTAAFLYNFARYTEWPDSSTADADRPIVFAVIGNDRVVRALLRLGKQPLNGRGIVARSVPVPDDGESRQGIRKKVGEADVVFVAAKCRKIAPPILDALSDNEVLTVGAFHGFIQDGGMLNLEIRDDRIRFEANPDSIKRRGLRLSSEVLGLAKIVQTERAAQ